MTTSKTLPTTPRALTTQQLQLLTTLYKFRYVTAELITQSQGAKHRRVILARLKILVDQNYIGQNYDKSYKIIGKPATYYLLPKGINVLRQQQFADPKVIRRLYYDKKKDDKHIAHRLNVFNSYVTLKQQYPNRFQFFSKTEIAGWKHVRVPRDLTDAFMRRNKGTPTTKSKKLGRLELSDNAYFISYYESTAKTWRVKTSIHRYVAYAESEKWEKATKQPFPSLLICCENGLQKRRIHNVAEQELEKSWVSMRIVIVII